MNNFLPSATTSYTECSQLYRMTEEKYTEEIEKNLLV